MLRFVASPAPPNLMRCVNLSVPTVLLLPSTVTLPPLVAFMVKPFIVLSDAISPNGTSFALRLNSITVALSSESEDSSVSEDSSALEDSSILEDSSVFEDSSTSEDSSESEDSPLSEDSSVPELSVGGFSSVFPP